MKSSLSLLTVRIKEKDDPKLLLNIHGYVPFHNKVESKEVLLSLVITDSYPVTYPKVYCLQEHDLDEDKNLPEKLNEAKLHHLQIWNHRNSSLLTILKHTINFSTLKCHIDKELHYANENGVSMEENKFPLNDNLSDLILNMNYSNAFLIQYSRKGRIKIDVEDSKKNSNTIFLTNKTILIEECQAVSAKFSNNEQSGKLMLKFEPFTLSIQCEDLKIAKKILASALNSNFLESGISFLRKSVLVTIRSSAKNYIQILFADECGNYLIDTKYMNIVLKDANNKLAEDVRKMNAFCSGLKEQLILKNYFKKELITNETVSIISEKTPIRDNNERIPDEGHVIYRDPLNLPSEIFQTIILLLSGKDIHSCRQINKTWNKEIKCLIWNSEFALKSLRSKLKINWKESNFIKTTDSYTLNFHCPQIVATTSNSFLVYESLQEYEKFALINIDSREVWVIEENKSNFQTFQVKINNNIIAIYKEDSMKKGKLKAYSIKNRQLIFEEEITKLLDLLIDSTTSAMLVVLITEDYIKTLSFQNFGSTVQRINRGVHTPSKPHFSHLEADFLSFGIYDEDNQTSSFHVWMIDPKNDYIHSYKNIQDLETFVHGVVSKNNLLHKALYIPSLIISHGCNSLNNSDTCCIRILNEEGDLMKQIIFNDFFDDCLGEINFLTSSNRTHLFILRKTRNEGLYFTEIPPENGGQFEEENISNTKLQDLEQLRDDTFYITKLECTYVINSTSVASISIKENSMYENSNNNCMFTVKKLQFWGHN